MKQAFPTDARISPPVDLAPACARAWERIVNSLPADYFRPSDEQILRAYVEADHFRSMAYEELQRDGMFLVTERGSKYAHPAHSMMLQQASCMATLATKLRLCPSARIAKGEKAPKGQAGHRPWSDAKVA